MSRRLSTPLRGIKVKKKEQQKQYKNPKEEIARNNVENIQKLKLKFLLGYTAAN